VPVPTWAVGLGGAAVALAYAAAIEKMRLGPPLVMIVLGGMTLAFVARALWRVLDPLTRVRIRTGAFIPDVAVDPRNGMLYADAGWTRASSQSSFAGIGLCTA